MRSYTKKMLGKNIAERGDTLKKIYTKSFAVHVVYSQWYIIKNNPERERGKTNVMNRGDIVKKILAAVLTYVSLLHSAFLHEIILKLMLFVDGLTLKFGMRILSGILFLRLEVHGLHLVFIVIFF